MKSAKMEKTDKEVLRLFVYGTLRKGGVAADYLKGQRLLHENLQLRGFAMYDAGWYPFIVPAGADSMIMGDVYEVEKNLMPMLDQYEGEGYVQHYLEEEKLLLYLKADKVYDGFEQVKEGDWLQYWKRKSEKTA